MIFRLPDPNEGQISHQSAKDSVGGRSYSVAGNHTFLPWNGDVLQQAFYLLKHACVDQQQLLEVS
jgi:hypothetical protein